MSQSINTIEALREIIGSEIPGLEDKNIDHLDSFARDFIENCPFIVLSTSDEHGNCDASPKGDAAGFVYVENDKSLVIPDRPGNKLAYGHRNILRNPNVGLLFAIPGTTETLRVNGTAELDADPALLAKLEARGKPAVIAIRVSVKECFFHCGKAFIRSGLWSPDQWPKEPYKVSFGEMYASRNNLGKDVVDAVDASIESDYSNNL